MTVRSILNAKGHQVVSVEPDTKLSAAVKILSERHIGSVLVMSGTRIDGSYRLRCAILCFRTHLEHVDDAVDAVLRGVEALGG